MVANVGKALEAYERELVSGDSPFDRYVAALRRGDPAARRPAPARGAARASLFVGPAHCNLVPLRAGSSATASFTTRPAAACREGLSTRGRADGIRALATNPFNGAGALQRRAASGAARDRLEFLPGPQAELGKFKTPTLRNVALTAPYMHDGHFATLREVLQFYAEGKAASRGRVVGRREATLDLVPRLTQNQISDLIAFLDSLTGAPLPAALTRRPERP